MNNLHFLQDEKFTEPFIQFINTQFNETEHQFFIIGNSGISSLKPRQNVVRISKRVYSLFQLIREMNQCKKIFLHSLFFKNIVLLLCFQPWLLKKCYWIIWGADLYEYLKPKKTIPSKFFELTRSYVIKRFIGLVTPIKGDYDLAKKWYEVKGKYYYNLGYPSNLYKEFNFSKLKKVDSEIYIQIGNSADPSNDHLEILKNLHAYKDSPIKIICPLSYGDIEYRDKVIHYGRNVFGDKFIPLIEFLPFENYLEFLARIDIAIFNHKRQQAIGNITTLIGLGKKVYIRGDITTWNFCTEHNLKVFNLNQGFENLFEEMNLNIRNENIKNVKKQFSQRILRRNWEDVFES